MTRISLLTGSIGAALLGVALLGAPAGATTPTFDEAVLLSWDGGATKGATTTETFVGLPVIVPGDSASRTLTVTNDGPEEGRLTAVITNVVVVEPADPVFDEIVLSWDGGSATFEELTSGDRTIFVGDLAKGASVPIQLTYAFDEDSTEGNAADGDVQRSVTFDVVLTLEGEALPAPTQPPTPPTSAPPSSAPPVSAPPPSASPSASLTRPPLVTTGADVRLPAAVALVLVAGGGAALLTRRRQQRAQ